MNYVELMARVIGGALEVRATPNRISDVSGDMQRFINAASLPLDIDTATPTDGVLLHMFGICTNALLALARRPPITGPSWDVLNAEGSEIVAGSIRVGFSSSAWLANKHAPRNLEWSVIPSNIVPSSFDYIYSGIIPGTSLYSYQMEHPSTMAISFINQDPTDLFATHSVYGRVMFKFPSHYMAPSTDAQVPGVHIGTQTYVTYPNTLPGDAIKLNGVSVRVNEWMDFDGEFTLRSFAPFAGTLIMTFDIRFTGV